MTNLIRKVMDNLSNLTSAPYTDEQREALAHAQATVAQALEAQQFDADMDELKTLAASILAAAAFGYGRDDGRSIFDELVDEIGAPA